MMAGEVQEETGPGIHVRCTTAVSISKLPSAMPLIDAGLGTTETESGQPRKRHRWDACLISSHALGTWELGRAREAGTDLTFRLSEFEINMQVICLALFDALEILESSRRLHVVAESYICVHNVQCCCWCLICTCYKWVTRCFISVF